MLFAELTYTLATEEAERIGVDHVARMTATGTGENSTGNHSNDRRRVLGSIFCLGRPVCHDLRLTCVSVCACVFKWQNTS